MLYSHSMQTSECASISNKHYGQKLNDITFSMLIYSDFLLAFRACYIWVSCYVYTSVTSGRQLPVMNLAHFPLTVHDNNFIRNTRTHCLCTQVLSLFLITVNLCLRLKQSNSIKKIKPVCIEHVQRTTKSWYYKIM